MTLTEKLALAAVILSFITLVLVIYLLFIKNKRNQNTDLKNTISDKFNYLENSLIKNSADSFVKYNNNVSNQLISQQRATIESISSLRLNVNKELGSFRDKIDNSLEKDFQLLNDNINRKMSEINNKVEDRLSQGFKDTNETFNQIVKRVEVIDEAQKHIKDLSEEMVSLQNILSNNQARGAFGEYKLNQLLFGLFGENKSLYETQYTIKKKSSESVRADAVVFMPKGLVCIDSKFPYASYSQLFDNKDLSKEEESKILSSFSRDVKKHITDIANKYIIPNITTDYAIMFVPSDGILAMIHSRLMNVVEYSREKSVSIVSPTTLVPLLSSFQSMLIDYKRSEYIDQIVKQLKELKTSFKQFDIEWVKLNNSIDRLKTDGDKINKRVEKITTKFNNIDKVSFIENDKQVLIDDKKNQ